MKSKKVEHILPKSVKIELLKNLKRRKNMLFRYFTEKLLGLQDILIENIEEIDGSIHIYCKLELKMHEYPVCGKHTDKIHDYRQQVIKDIPAFGKFVSQEEQIPFFGLPQLTLLILSKKSTPH